MTTFWTNVITQRVVYRAGQAATAAEIWPNGNMLGGGTGDKLIYAKLSGTVSAQT